MEGTRLFSTLAVLTAACAVKKGTGSEPRFEFTKKSRHREVPVPFFTPLFSTLILLTTLCPVTAADKPIRSVEGKVIAIPDGNSIVLVDSSKVQHKITLLGVDAPEVGQGKGSPGQSFAKEAREELQRLVLKQQVVVDWQEKDRTGRIRGDVYAPDKSGADVWINLKLIQDGFAWHDIQHDERAELAEAEMAAHEAQRGLWADPNAIAPWEWRKTQRGAKPE